MTENLKYSNRVDLAKPVLWLAFAAYVFLSGYTIAHHEMWGDEIHSWNIVKASAGFFDYGRYWGGFYSRSTANCIEPGNSFFNFPSWSKR